MADVEIRGLRELGVVLLGAPDKLKWRVLRDATEGMAEVIQDAAEQNAPVFTGRLKRSIVRRRQRPVRDREWFKVAVRKSTYYWKFQEYGSSRNPAHPFMRPAVAEKGAEAVNVFKARFAAGVLKVMAK